MAAERLLEVYRFNEQGGTYEHFTVILYPFKGRCVIKGLNEFNLADRRELFAHLRKKGVKYIHYQHKGRDKTVCL